MPPVACHRIVCFELRGKCELWVGEVSWIESVVWFVDGEEDGWGVFEGLVVVVGVVEVVVEGCEVDGAGVDGGAGVGVGSGGGVPVGEPIVTRGSG